MEREHGSDIDDLATLPLLDELLGHRLRKEEHCLLVDVDDVIPILLGKHQNILTTDNASIIDQNIDLPHHFDGFSDDLFQSILSHQVGGNVVKLASQ
ncbi:hypothetical protein D3C85_1072260 [compost metagenome]